MLSFRNNILTYCFLVISTCVYAQYIDVKDPVLQTFLCNQYPLAVANNCTQLDTNKAKSEYPVIAAIHAANRSITDASPILYFENADTVNLNNNALTSFPDNISSFRSLDRLNLSNNQLTAAPTIKYTHAISGDTAVKLVYLQYNNITQLPSNWAQYNGKTQVIDLKNNYLQDVPSFSNYPEIRRLDVSENYLSFEDLIPIMANPRWTTSQFDLFPQREFEVAMDTLVEIGDTLKVNISTGLTTNTYRLLKGDRGVEDNATGEFKIIIESESDLGEYWFKVYNSNFPATSDFLASKKYLLTLKEKTPPNELDTVTYPTDVVTFSPNNDDVGDTYFVDGVGEASFYTKNGQKIRIEQLPFTWKGDDKKGTLLEPGLYLININNTKYIKVLIAY